MSLMKTPDRLPASRRRLHEARERDRRHSPPHGIPKGNRVSAAKEEQRESTSKTNPDAVEESEGKHWREAKKHYSLSPLPANTKGSSSSGSCNTSRVSHVPPLMGKQKSLQNVGQPGREWYSIDGQNHGTQEGRQNACIGNTSSSSSRISFGFDDSYGGVLGDGGTVTDGMATSAPAGSCRSDTAGATGEGNQERESVRYVAESFVGTVIDCCCTPRVDNSY